MTTLSAILLGFAGVGLARDGTSCKEAQAWVHENPAALPVTAKELAELTPTYRRYAFDALAPEIKSEIWRQQLEGALAERPLNAGQRELAREAISIFSPSFYRDHQRAPEEWRTRVASAFPRQEAVEIFETLGPASQLLPSCSCLTDFDCTGGRECNFESCNITVSGCGPGGGESCTNGVCRFP